MNNIFKIIILSIFVYTPQLAVAQSYKGDYSSTPSQIEKKDEAAAPVPKVFSSKIGSVEQAEKLDVIYNDLLISLWIYASTDFVYQNSLLENMESNRFQLTRYKKEFSGDLQKSIENLNKNYKNMMNDIEVAQEKYLDIKEMIRNADHKALDKLWDDKISKFKLDSKRYFKMQYKFINFYNSLVNFILKQGGSYYFDSDKQQVIFYNFGGYKFFGQSIDKLNQIHYMQVKLLKTYKPANTDIVFK